MSNHNFISVNLHCTPELWQAIQSQADKLGQDPAYVAINTLNEAFGLNKTSKNIVRHEELDLLNRKLTIIEQAIKPFLIDPQLGQKLTKLVSDNLDNLPTPTAVNTQISLEMSRIDVSTTSTYSLTTDDVEDEPDEILYDFL